MSNNNFSDIEDKPLSYNGSDPYIFVSFAPEDAYAVFPEIKRFQKSGYNVSYDDGSGINNDEAIKASHVYVVFFTPNSAKSEEITHEVELASENEKHILPIYLVETNLDLNIDFHLTGMNSISKFKMNLNEYVSKYRQSFKQFGLSPNNELETKLVPGVGREPLPAFRGEGSYAFISYAHVDSDIVYPEIKRFQDMGYNIWYDEGIGAGNEWLRDVLEHLLGADLFIVFITNNSVASINVQKEIKFAISKGKNILPIYLEDFDEIDMDIQMDYELSAIQGILKTTLDEEEYVFKFTEAFQNFGFKPSEEFGNEIFEKLELKKPEDILMDDALKNDVLYSDFDSKSIFSFVNDFFDDLTLYDDYYNGHYYKDILKSSIDVFLSKKTNGTALEVYKTFFSIYQPQVQSDKITTSQNTVLELIDIIKEYVTGETDMDKIQKNLFIHSVNVFLFGLAVYSHNEKYRDFFREYVTESPYDDYYTIENEFSHEEFLFRWGITALLHDIYYPFEKTGQKQRRKLYKEFDQILGKDRAIDTFEDLNEVYKGNPQFSDDYANTFPKSKFLDLFKPSDLISHKISIDFPKITINRAQKNLDSLVDLIKESQFEEHGILSACLVLNSYAYQIQEHEKNPSIFFYPIVESATAIFLHNYYRYFLQNDPFNLKELHPSHNPIAYMLILCDTALEFRKKPETILDNNVNEFSDIQISYKQLEATYIVKSSSYGFDLSNELILDDILDIDSIFDDGLAVIMDLNIENDYEIFISSHDLSNNLNNAEKIAQQLHKQYNNNIIETYEQRISEGKDIPEPLQSKYDNLTEFNDLSPQLILSNIQTAKRIPNQLNIIGCEIAELSDKREAIREFSKEEMNALVVFSHEDWCRVKIATGWTYGEKRDDANLIHDCLIPWHQLPAEMQKYDMEVVNNLPHLIESVGFKIVSSKLRLLTAEIYNFCQEESGGYDFEKLPLYIKRLNYKKTDLILESLFKLDYYIVDESQTDNKIEEFEKDEMIYLAQDNHDKWHQLNNSLGWKYGENYDISLKTNPNLVAWEKLSFRYAKMQIEIFKHLPKFCSAIDLKIVKIDPNYLEGGVNDVE